MIRGSITNPTEDEILKGKLPGNVNYGIQGPPGLKGSEGGYYIPDVTQMDENTIQFTFEPSKTDMPVVDPTTLELPAGSGIDVSGAAPGQTVKIAAVDDNGRPTSWEPADFPESGGNVAYDEEQELTEEQKAQARANIGAQPVGEYLTEVPEGYAKNEDIKKVDRKVDTLREVVSKFHSNIVCDSKGEVITVSDSSDMELAGLRIFGKTTQNGTPTPDAPVPLESIGKSVSVMVCGKNMLDVSQFTNGSQLTITNGAINITTSNNSITVNTGKKLAELAPSLEVGKNYILTFKTTGTTNMIFLYHANTYWYSNSALSITQKHLDSTVFLYASGKSTTATITDMMIRFASAIDASYEPYKEIQTLTISTPNGLPGIPVTSGGNYTDEKGQQWICDEVDFEKGVYVQRVGKYTFTGTEEWLNHSAGALQCRPNFKRGSEVGTYGQCECIPYVYSYRGSGIYVEGLSIFLGTGYVEMYGITVENIGAIMAGNLIQYVLYQTEETPLNAQQLAAYAALHANYPNTTVFNDGGAGMEVKYVADTKLYVDKKFAELSAALLIQ